MQQQKKNYLILSFLTLGLCAGTANAELSVGGYADAQYNWNNTSGVGGNKNVHSTVNTFRFSEGALYLTEKQDTFSANLDLAIAGQAKRSTRGFTTTPSSNAISVGLAKSQAYISIKPMENLTWTMGQFDSIIGYEAKDSVNYAYAEAGLLAAAMPVTHVGLLSHYSFSEDFGIKFLIANPYDQGHMLNGNIDIGGKVMAKFSSVAVNLGLLVSTGDHAALGLKRSTGYIADLDVSTSFDVLKATLFATAHKNDIEKAQTDIGVGLDFGYALNDSTNLGLRVEYEMDGESKSAIGATADDTTLQATVGPQFKLSEELVTKLDYTYQQITFDNGGANLKAHNLNLAAVYQF